MLTALIGPVTGLLDKFIEDKDQKNRLAHDIATMSEKHANALAKEQAKANTEAAKHPHDSWTCTCNKHTWMFSCLSVSLGLFFS